MKRLLVACEESQRVTAAFRARGWEAYSCDLQECSGGHPEWHILGDCRPLLNGNCEFVTMDGTNHSVDSWDMLIAHPPCTFLTNASAVRMRVKGEIVPERYDKMLEGREFFHAVCQRKRSANLCRKPGANADLRTAKIYANHSAIRIWASIFKAHLPMAERTGKIATDKHNLESYTLCKRRVQKLGWNL